MTSMKKPLLTGKLYDLLKFIALVLLPALGSAYFALSDIWGLPDGKQVVGSITVVDTFLGGVLHLSNLNYNTFVASANTQPAPVDPPTESDPNPVGPPATD